ncbi:MAG: MarR family transcriptional regulator [Pseudomonadota bacterium]
MPPDINELTPSELAVLESLHGASQSVSQRELARRTGLSVGLINAVIKRLVHTGYVKTGHLNKRQLEYLLTPEGFARTALRSYHYVVRTVESYRRIRGGLVGIINKLSTEGITRFYLHGEGELAGLVVTVFSELGYGELRRGVPDHLLGKGGDSGERCMIIKGRREVVLNTTPSLLEVKGCRRVDLVSELGNGTEQDGDAKGHEVM